ncbi:MAG TPA: hypothetical protein VGB15_16480 [Longimicrobium sp.]
MRSVYSALAALVLIPAATLLGACDDPFAGIEPQIRADSLVLSAANSNGPNPSALDIFNNARPARPELPAQAGSFDLQVRLTGSVFSLIPSPATGNLRGAGLQKTTRSIDDPGEAPREVADYTREAMNVAVGETFFVQTRPGGGCGTTSKYAILKVLAADPATGNLTVRVISNQACDDERLEL